VLDLVTAIRFDGRVQSGKTMPCKLACETAAGDEVEVVAKLSAGCERGVGALVSEAIAAVLAADLGLPVPEPFLVRVDADFVASIPDPEIVALASRSSAVLYGSKRLPPGYTSLPVGKQVPKDAIPVAAEIFAFDALIANPDRRPDNPNCLFQGSNLAIFDHELAFLTEGVIGWRPPWEVGSLEGLRRPQSHLFFDQLCGKALNFDRFRGAWATVTDLRLEAYRNALPMEWNAADQTAVNATRYVTAIRDNLPGAMLEIVRVLQ
jgi:hypothetical protein